MARRLILGIDVGTTSVKAGLLDTNGAQVAAFSERYDTARSGDNVVEQDPRDWTRLIDAAIAQFVGAGFGPDIAAIGLTSQVNTHVFVGADGVPLMPAVVWQDTRAVAEAAALDARVTADQKIGWWGAPMPIDASHALSRMAWVARHRPEVWDATARVLLPKDYCIAHLTGDTSTDPLSAIGLVDSNLHYIPEVLALVPGAAERMAPLIPVTDSAGIARGLLKGRPVASGTMDAWAGLVGAGGAQEGSTVYLSGTSEILGISSRTVVPTPGVIVFPQCAGIRLHAAPTQSGGDAAAWFAALARISLEQMSAMAARATTSPLFLPQLEGERAPLWDGDLRAAFLGVSRQTSQADLARAVFEGVSFSARHGLEALQTSADTRSDTITCGGGGFRSDIWAQIRADVLGTELHVLDAAEPGVLGAATIAAISASDYADAADAQAALARFGRRFAPDAKAHARYDDRFALYKDAIEGIAGLTARLSRIPLGERR
ncbi:FGGY-family carbohydrate kinase [Rhodobacteraceae bacterium N5(2021)]|uniref:FGGY-family carbohydrate kinase n=1 Tax=Gymnodinialimonas phycosphaerae TaxID=2841589 RepID=A0A975TVY5_9RHOB|nr:FGGY-family carbohydrate kinase [Gymnodinialimonas phycosphaerae]MBY4891393.1 FGGY-family carbohydrate kinase [Gymnodinialimonas phycosphaerae]